MLGELHGSSVGSRKNAPDNVLLHDRIQCCTFCKPHYVQQGLIALRADCSLVWKQANTFQHALHSLRIGKIQQAMNLDFVKTVQVRCRQGGGSNRQLPVREMAKTGRHRSQQWLLRWIQPCIL